MKNSFSPSVNIVRDFNKDIDYISTPNAERVIDTLNLNVTKGIKSFFLIGSYGTGKSAFLLAFEKQLHEKGKLFFETPILFNGKTKFNPLNIIGDFRSLEDSFREELKIGSSRDLFSELTKLYNKSASKNMGLLLVIDEFGKFLEYAANNDPEKELYTIQKLAEFVNDSDKNSILITTLHQNVEAYGNKLNNKQKNEWAKVKGRLKEIAFNEPVEQLLYLAAQKLDYGKKNVSKTFRQLYKIIASSNVYPLKNVLSEELAQKLFPLDMLSAATLTLALKKYGQNDRSLFTFLNTADFTKRKDIYHLASVYDYLINNFYSFLSSKYNDDFFKWTIIKNSLDRIGSGFAKDSKNLSLLIKAIGLLNIFAPKGARINENILVNYCKYAFGIANSKKYLELLLTHKILRYQTYTDSYILYEGTDLDIDLALKDAETKITYSQNISAALNIYFNLPHKPAKAAYIEKGTPRFFEYIISEHPVIKKPVGETDGYINLIFHSKLDKQDILNVSKKNNEPILYIHYNNSDKINDNLFEIEKVNFVLGNNIEDRVAYRELKNLKENLINELNDLVINNLFKEKRITWFFQGKQKEVKNQKDFNRLLTDISNIVYNKTPVFHNELINREKLSAAISKARKNLLSGLIENWDKEDLAFEKFPPEKAIYLSLLKNTGIHRKEKNEFILEAPTDKTFNKLWECCEIFINSSKTSKKSLVDLVEILSSKPFKLKRGFIDFWLPIYLFIKRDDYALFDNDVYIPYLSSDLFEMILKNPKNYFIKAFDVQGIKFDLFNRYRNFINKSRKDKITNESFVDTIRPFLTFYRGLPEYTRKTNRLTGSALALRKAIVNAKDPEKTFFEEFPAALGYSSQTLYESDKYLKDYIKLLQNTIRELRVSFDNLVDRIEDNLVTILGYKKKTFPDYKNYLQARYSSIKSYLLLPYQKTLHQRINSGLDDRKSWLSSIVQGLIGKNLENINDDDEQILYDKLSNLIHEFDSLSEFANLQVDEQSEEAYKVEITSINDGLQGGIIRLSIEQRNKAKKIEQKIKNNLGPDKKLNQIALLNMLKKELQNGKG